MSKLWIMYYKSSKAREVSPEELAMVFCFGFLFGFFKEPDPLAIHSDLGCFYVLHGSRLREDTQEIVG